MREKKGCTGQRITMVALNGGPVSQLERRTMPRIIDGAVSDLQQKGVSIGLVGDAHPHDITVVLKVLDWSEFVLPFFASAWKARGLMKPDGPFSEVCACMSALKDGSRERQLHNLDNVRAVAIAQDQHTAGFLVWRDGTDSHNTEVLATGLDANIMESQLTLTIPANSDATGPMEISICSVEEARARSMMGALQDVQAHNATMQAITSLPGLLKATDVNEADLRRLSENDLTELVDMAPDGVRVAIRHEIKQVGKPLVRLCCQDQYSAVLFYT
jgi:hypothetical protein